MTRFTEFQISVKLRLPAGALRVVHSGDVKLYENTQVLPRAFVVHRTRLAPRREDRERWIAEVGEGNKQLEKVTAALTQLHILAAGCSNNRRGGNR